MLNKKELLEKTREIGMIMEKWNEPVRVGVSVVFTQNELLAAFDIAQNLKVGKANRETTFIRKLRKDLGQKKRETWRGWSTWERRSEEWWGIRLRSADRAVSVCFGGILRISPITASIFSFTTQTHSYTDVDASDAQQFLSTRFKFVSLSSFFIRISLHHLSLSLSLSLPYSQKNTIVFTF